MPAIKDEARKRFMAQYGACVGVQITLMLITSLLSWITGRMIDLDTLTLSLLIDPWGAIGNGLAYMLLMLLVSVFIGTISIEASYFYLRVFRGERMSVRDFLTNLPADVGKKVGADLWMSLFLNLWALAAAAPFVIVVVLAFQYMSMPAAMGMLDVLIWFFACAVGALLIVKALSYSMMPYLIRDCPGVSIRKSMRLSIALTRGNKRKLFVLMLSFLGWALLSLFTFGVLIALYVGPYVAVSVAGVYHHLKSAGLEAGVITKAELEGAD